jgi:glycosyltransferase involved in cell wall biosynthesis
MEMKKTYAVIPARNEEKNIFRVVKKARKHVDKVILVDDGSTDRTSLMGKKAGAIVIKHLVNLGKGAALKTGCDFAVRKGAGFIVVLDADAQHNPNDIPRFLKKLNDFDVVFGTRIRSVKMPLVLRFGNWFISKSARLLYGFELSDTQCGFRAFSSQSYKKIRWNSPDYSMESEMIARAGRQRLKYTQLPIQTIYSDKYKGTTILDGIKIVLNMIWWKLFNGNSR